MSTTTLASPVPCTRSMPSTGTGADRAMEVLAAGRVVLGIGALVAPARLVGSFGLASSPALDYMTRIYGGRAIALGVGYLTEPAEQRGRWHRLGLFVDTADTLTAIGHLVRRDIPRTAATALAGLTGGYAAVGLLRLSGQRGDTA